MSQLKGRRALVTGASKGIGAAIAQELAAAGAAVAVNYATDRAGADAVVKQITVAGGRAMAIQGDVSKSDDVRRLFVELGGTFDWLDVLVNNAGVYKPMPIEELTEEEFHREFNTNGPMSCNCATAGDMARVAARQLNELALQLAQADDIFQKQARLRLERMSQHLDELLRYELVFSQTETWRTVYQAILSRCQTKRYLSVALVEHEDYWRDQPAQASLEFNYDLVRHGFFVHRRFIIDEFFWPPGTVHPASAVLTSIDEQATNGVEVSLIRKSDLDTEPHLVRDFGIYGERAAGFQSLDDQARTTSYLMRFGRQAVEEAEELWRQLDLYAIPLEELREQRA